MLFQVVETAHGNYGIEKWLMCYHHQEIWKPQWPDYYHQHDFVNWYVEEVF